MYVGTEIRTRGKKVRQMKTQEITITRKKGPAAESVIDESRLKMTEQIISHYGCRKNDDVWSILAETKVNARPEPELMRKIAVALSAT